MTQQCRVCWEPDGELYELPCKCKGSVGTVHVTCFVHTMVLRSQVGQGGCCDVCKARLPLPPGVDIVHFRCLCYNVFFIFLLYLLLASLCCVLWVHEFDTLSATARQRCVIQFSAILVTLQPTLWVVAYVCISLHVTLHDESAELTEHEDAAKTYKHYLTTYGRSVAAV